MFKSELPFFYGRGLAKDEEVFFAEFEKECKKEYVDSANIYFNFGYETLGIILLGFSRWLINNLRERGTHKVLFLSRDGLIMKRAFELLPESRYFETEYIYVSRRSLRVPLLWCSNTNRKKAICPTKYITIKDLIDSLGLDPLNYIEQIEASDFELNTLIKEDEIENNGKVVSFLDGIWNDVISNSKVEYESLVSYIRGFNLNEDVAIVDIGWRGSMQLFLEEILRKLNFKNKICGYYITLSSSMYRGMDMYGYLKNVDSTSAGCDLLRGYVGLIELMFMCSEGSVLRYGTDKNGTSFPILSESEYIENGIKGKEIRAIEEVQKGALTFIKNIVCLPKWENISFSSEVAFLNMNNFANYPSKKALEMFGEFRFFNNGTVSYVAGKRNKDYSLANIKKLKKELYESRWRIGFLKQTFKIHLPYYLIFKMLMKVAM